MLKNRGSKSDPKNRPEACASNSSSILLNELRFFGLGLCCEVPCSAHARYACLALMRAAAALLERMGRASRRLGRNKPAWARRATALGLVGPPRAKHASSIAVLREARLRVTGIAGRRGGLPLERLPSPREEQARWVTTSVLALPRQVAAPRKNTLPPRESADHGVGKRC